MNSWYWQHKRIWIIRIVLANLMLIALLAGFLPALPTTQAQGGPLTYGTSLIASLSPQVPLGIYSFNGTTGDLVTIHVASVDGSLNPTLDLVAPSQQYVTYSEDYAFGPGATDAYLSVTLHETGAYSILISGANNTQGDYLLRLAGRPAVASVTLQYNQPIEVIIPQFPQPQYFSFEAGDCLTTLLVTNRLLGSPFTFPFTALVRDQDGTRIAMLQGGRAVDDAVTVMPHSGRYEIELLSADPYTSGKVKLWLICADDMPVCDTPSDQLYFPLDPQNPSQERPPVIPDIPRPDSNDTPSSSTGPSCGNGVLEAGEACDPPNGTTCNQVCQLIPQQPACGNGVLEAGEACDPPDGVTCDQACQLIPQQPVCGNGILEAGEACDPPDGATCDQACQLIPQQPVCGNGILEAGEACDPPDGATCNEACLIVQMPQVEQQPVCGNQIVETGEACDPPNGTTCDQACQLIPQPVCGNQIVEAGEECDGNIINCSEDCKITPLYFIPSFTTCGNGIIDSQYGETCEPPNTTGCDAECHVLLY